MKTSTMFLYYYLSRVYESLDWSIQDNLTTEGEIINDARYGVMLDISRNAWSE